MNIENVSHQCSLRCSYQFDYGTSACVMKNNTANIEFAYDDGVSTIYFNQDMYVVKTVRFYNMVYHRIDGNSPVAELIVHLHKKDSMTQNLMICIPFSQNDSPSNSNTMWNQIMPHLPDANQQVSVNVPNFSLNAFMPKGSYYYYKGTDQINLDNVGYDMIVFDHTVWQSISSANMTLFNSKTISSVPTPFTIPTTIYYNKLGTTAGNIDNSDDIYIDCQPTDDGPDILPKDDTPQIQSVLDEQKQEKIWMIIYAIIAFVLMFIVGFITFYVFKILKPRVAELFTDSPRKAV
jgi:carbonic anhydrase